MSIKREVSEPINLFNNRFHGAYIRLQSPYVVNDASTKAVYYAALDNIIATLVKRMHQTPQNLVDTYVVVKASDDLGQHLTGPLPSLGLVANLG